MQTATLSNFSYIIRHVAKNNLVKELTTTFCLLKKVDINEIIWFEMCSNVYMYQYVRICSNQ
jgi:hypothetical protein